MASQKGPNTNESIKAPKVRVIDTEGNQLGILDVKKAQEIANEQGMDLVEVSPHVDPPVCRFMDYGKYKYQQSKKTQKKKTQQTVQTKEIKLRPFTGDHDLEVKLRHILDFLDKGNRVKVTMVFRGRELKVKEQGSELLLKIAEQSAESGTVEREPKLEGRNMVMVLAPKIKQ